MGEFEDMLGDMGVKQWVRNKFVAKLKDFKSNGDKDYDKFVNEFNIEILEEFKKVANESIIEAIYDAIRPYKLF